MKKLFSGLIVLGAFLVSTLLAEENLTAAQRYAKAAAFYQSGEFSDAITQLDRILIDGPGAGFVVEFSFYNMRGACHYMNGDFEEAIADYEKAEKMSVGQDSDFRAGVMAFCGQAYRAIGDSTNALACFNRALKESPDDYQVQSNAAWFFATVLDERIKDPGRALDLAKSIEKKVGKTYARSTLAVAYVAAGEGTKALDLYNEMLEEGGENPDTLNQCAWFLATTRDESIRDAKRAIKLVTKACELTKWKNAAYLDTLGAAYATDGDFEKAVKFTKQALDHCGEHCREIEDHLELFKEKKPHFE